MTHSMRVLLVEDSPGDARLFEEEAKDGGLEDLDVTRASRVDEALRLYEPGAFDVILLDLNLPDAKGVRTVERVSAAALNTPVVVLTTLADDGLVEQAIAAGAEDYLVKGEAEPWQLVRALRSAVARSRRGSDRQPRTPEQAEAVMENGVPETWFGDNALKSSLPNVFDDLVLTAGDLIDMTQRCAAGTERQVLLPRVRALGARLAMLSASPRDVLDVLRAATARKLLGSAWDNAAAQARASRWALVAVMSELCLTYRREVLDDASHAS